MSSGLAPLDAQLAGGLARGTSTLIMGPAGTGKSSLATQFVYAAAAREERSTMLLFDETAAALLQRSSGLGMPLEPLMESGMVNVRQIDPAELSPGEFVAAVRDAVEVGGTRMLVIDSLSGFLNAMPSERFLLLHLHELLTYLNHKSVTTLLVMVQHGMVGSDSRSAFDASYLADTVLLLRHYEAAGALRQALSVVKKRTGRHERTIRELHFDDGIEIGEPIRDLAGRAERRAAMARAAGRSSSAVTVTSSVMEQRVLVLAPTAADGVLCATVLTEAGFAHTLCPDLAALARAVREGAAAILLTDESLGTGDTRPLVEVLQEQPAWSDLPIVLLCGSGADSPRARWALDVLGNVTVFDRPVRVTTLVSGLRAACRARRRQYELREGDRRKDEFLATLSHELRNPLAPLRNALHLLRITPDADGAQVRLVYDLMGRQVEHLVRLVDDLLELSRVTRGTLALRVERIDVADVVRSAIETSEPLIAAAGHRLEVSLPGRAAVGRRRRGAPRAGRLESAQQRGEVHRRGRTHRCRGAARAELRRHRRARQRIRHLPAALHDVFEMFSRGDRTQRGGEAGLGIGLAIARRLAEMHAGTLSARSAGLGEGSEFVVRLPLATEAPRTDDETRAEAFVPPGRILVVDDNRDAAQSLGMLLEALGAEVRVACDGAEALQVFQSYDPAVVLMDIGMPVMDGYEVARRMRTRFPERRPTIVAVTGWGQEEDRRRARDAGFDHHLIKPPEIAALQALLASVPSAAGRHG